VQSGGAGVMGGGTECCAPRKAVCWQGQRKLEKAWCDQLISLGGVVIGDEGNQS